MWGGGGSWPWKIFNCTITKPEKEGEDEESEDMFYSLLLIEQFLFLCLFCLSFTDWVVKH